MKTLAFAPRPVLALAAIILLAALGGCTCNQPPPPRNPGPHPHEGKETPAVGNPGPHQ